MSGASSARLAAVLALVAPLAACDPPERSDNERWRLYTSLVDRLGYDAHRVLVDSSFRVQPAWLTDAYQVYGADALEGCVTYGASGSIAVDDQSDDLAPGEGRFLVAAAGPGVVELPAPIEACPDLGGLADQEADTWSLLGVAADDGVVARWRSSADNDAFVWQVSPGPAGAFPVSLGLPLERVQVVADGEFLLTPVLVQPAVDPRQEIRFDQDEDSLILPGHYADLEARDDSGVALAYLHGSLGAGDRLESGVTLSVAGHDFAMPPIETVGEDRIASLELIPAYFPGDRASREWASPVGVLAITRDAEGERIVGAPIEWSLTRGVLDFRVAEPGDVVSLSDTCQASPDKDPEQRGATVEASVAGLVTSVDLEWLAVPGEVLIPDSSNPNCVGGGCSCSSGGDAEGSLAAALGLLLLGLGRRRRAQEPSARKRP